MRNHAIGAIVLLSLVSCASVDSVPVTAILKPIPTYPYSPVVVSESKGTLLYQNDCLIFRNTRGQQYVLIWPDGSSFDGKKVTVVTPERAPKTLTVGREVMIGGSAQEWGNVPASPGLGDTAKRCGAVPYFVVEV